MKKYIVRAYQMRKEDAAVGDYVADYGTKVCIIRVFPEDVDYHILVIDKDGNCFAGRIMCPTLTEDNDERDLFIKGVRATLRKDIKVACGIDTHERISFVL